MKHPFTQPEARRGLRSIVQAGVVVACCWLLYLLCDKLSDDLEGLRLIAKGALLIVGIGTVFYGLENTTRAFEFAIGKDGIKARSDGDAPAVAQAAHAVADAAVDKAEEFKAEPVTPR